jgi:hypothetical protein
VSFPTKSAAIDRITMIDIKELTVTEPTIVFDNLDILNQKFYRIVGGFGNADSIYQIVVKMFVNDVEDAAQYEGKGWTHSTYNDTGTCEVSPNINKGQDASIDVLIIKDGSDRIRYSSLSVGISGLTEGINTGRSKFTVSNLTKIKLIPIRTVPGTPATGFTANSIFILYGYKKS